MLYSPELAQDARGTSTAINAILMGK